MRIVCRCASINSVRLVSEEPRRDRYIVLAILRKINFPLLPRYLRHAVRKVIFVAKRLAHNHNSPTLYLLRTVRRDHVVPTPARHSFGTIHFVNFEMCPVVRKIDNTLFVNFSVIFSNIGNITSNNIYIIILVVIQFHFYVFNSRHVENTIIKNIFCTCLYYVIFISFKFTIFEFTNLKYVIESVVIHINMSVTYFAVNKSHVYWNRYFFESCSIADKKHEFIVNFDIFIICYCYMKLTSVKSAGIAKIKSGSFGWNSCNKRTKYRCRLGLIFFRRYFYYFVHCVQSGDANTFGFAVQHRYAALELIEQSVFDGKVLLALRQDRLSVCQLRLSVSEYSTPSQENDAERSNDERPKIFGKFAECRPRILRNARRNGPKDRDASSQQENNDCKFPGFARFVRSTAFRHVHSSKTRVQNPLQVIPVEKSHKCFRFVLSSGRMRGVGADPQRRQSNLKFPNIIERTSEGVECRRAERPAAKQIGKDKIND